MANFGRKTRKAQRADITLKQTLRYLLNCKRKIENANTHWVTEMAKWKINESREITSIGGNLTTTDIRKNLEDLSKILANLEKAHQKMGIYEVYTSEILITMGNSNSTEKTIIYQIKTLKTIFEKARLALITITHMKNPDWETLHKEIRQSLIDAFYEGKGLIMLNTIIQDLEQLKFKSKIKN